MNSSGRSIANSSFFLFFFFFFFKKVYYPPWFGIQGKQSGGLQLARQLSRHTHYIYLQLILFLETKTKKLYNQVLCLYYSWSYTIEFFSNFSSLLLLMLICRSIIKVFLRRFVYKYSILHIKYSNLKHL